MSAKLLTALFGLATAVAQAATIIVGPPPGVFGGHGGITFAELGSTNTTANATAYTTSGSATPTANALLLAFVIVGDTAPIGNPTLDGTTDGLVGHGKTDWTDIVNVAFNDDGSGAQHRLYVFRYLAASPSAGTVTFNWSAGGLGCSIQLIEFRDVDTSGTEGSGAVVQSPSTSSEATANPAITMSALGSSANAVAVVVGDDLNSASDMAPETDWTELREFAFNTPATGSTYIYRLATSDNTVTTTATSRDWAIAAVEIKPP